ncbi:MAG TPA: CoA-binding protein [Phycisphaerales bacterium]|nr:CoA-binding protein [Phycisphaerales bacterium]
MRVMVIGASNDRDKFGNKAVRAFLRQGHEVVPVNPTVAEVEGLRTYPDVASVPGHVDRACFYVQPEVGVEVVRQVARRGNVDEVWLNPGADAPEVVAEAKRLGLSVVRACSIRSIGEVPD